MSPNRPVWRDDGRRYASMSAAARALAAEWGTSLGRGQVTSMATGIRGVLEGEAITAYGHFWYEHDPLADGRELARWKAAATALRDRSEALEGELGAMRARLENANDLLRANGLETQ